MKQKDWVPGDTLQAWVHRALSPVLLNQRLTPRPNTELAKHIEASPKQEVLFLFIESHFYSAPVLSYAEERIQRYMTIDYLESESYPEESLTELYQRRDEIEERYKIVSTNLIETGYELIDEEAEEWDRYYFDGINTYETYRKFEIPDGYDFKQHEDYSAGIRGTIKNFLSSTEGYVELLAPVDKTSFLNKCSQANGFDIDNYHAALKREW